MQVAAVSSLGGWIQVTADYILRLTRVPAARHELWLTPSHSWLEFRRPDTSYSWLHPTAGSSSDGWIRLKADSILQLTRVLAAQCELQLIPSCSWLRVAADSSSAGWNRLATVLYFNISSKFKDLLCKIHHFLWFVFCRLISVTTDSGSACCFKNLEEAWRSLKKLQDSSCDWL